MPPSHDGLRRRFSTFAPSPNFETSHRALLAAAANVTVLLHANATRLVLRDDGASVDAVEIASLGGRRGYVRARRYVICCGGVETPRLLLASRGPRTRGVGNDRDLVGRFFQEHAHVKLPISGADRRCPRTNVPRPANRRGPALRQVDRRSRAPARRAARRRGRGHLLRPRRERRRAGDQTVATRAARRVPAARGGAGGGASKAARLGGLPPPCPWPQGVRGFRIALLLRSGRDRPQAGEPRAARRSSRRARDAPRDR